MSVSILMLLPVHGVEVCFFGIVVTARMKIGSVLIKATRNIPEALFNGQFTSASP